MPYIDAEDRDKFEEDLKNLSQNIMSIGEMNYCITMLISNFVEGVHILKEAESGWANGYAQKKQLNLFPNVVDISLEFKPIQTRDSFGLDISEMEPGWNNSSWPYGVKIDPRLHTDSKASTKSTTQLADPRATNIIKAQRSGITK